MFQHMVDIREKEGELIIIDKRTNRILIVIQNDFVDLNLLTHEQYEESGMDWEELMEEEPLQEDENFMILWFDA